MNTDSRTPSRIILFLLIILQSWRLSLTPKKPEKPKVIWVLHQLLLGDTIMLTGLLSKLHQNYPNARVIMIGNPAFKKLYLKKPYQIEYAGYDPRNYRSLFKLLSLPRPDWALIPGDNRYGWLAFARRAKWIVGFSGDRPAYKQWCFNELLPLPDHPNSVVDLMQLLSPGSQAAPYKKEQWKLCTESLPKQFNTGSNYVLLLVGAKSSLKHWPTSYWVNLAKYLKSIGMEVVISAARGEEESVDKINAQLSLPSYRGTLNLLQLIEAMKKAKLVICLDNGAGQLARVVATPTICLFGGASVSLFAESNFWGSIDYQNLTEDMECRNVNTLFKRSISWINTCNRPAKECLHGRPVCMENIQPETVIQAVEVNSRSLKP